MGHLRLLTAGLVTLSLAALSARGAVIVNEFDYDQVGTDTAEFVELYNPDAAAEPLTGLSLVFFNGATTANTAYRTVALTGSIPSLGYVTIGNQPGATIPIGAASDAFQNGAPDSFGIYTGAAPTAATATNLVANTGITYEGTNATTPVEFLIVGATPADGDSNNFDASFSRIPDGSGAFVLTGTPTPGATNVLSALGIPEPAALAAACVAGLLLRRRRM
jgi:hypothetical protein